MFANARNVTLSYGEIDPAHVAELPADDRAGIQLIDVRQPEEWTAELGHIADASLLPLADLLLGGPPPGTDPARPVVLVCRSGKRSARAAAALAFFGFPRVYNLAGGMIAWNQTGLDVKRDR